MTNEAIAKVVDQKKGTTAVNIHFKQRTTITGIFVKAHDYADLKAKNLWRIVTEKHMDTWKRTQDIAVAKIFNGADFTKLVEATQIKI
ncbi:MAG: short-chain dehydrogenase [Chitinophagaceae bacterium]